MALFQSIYQLFNSFVPGFREVDGGDCLSLVKMLLNPNTAITALAGGAAGTATPLQYGWNRVDTSGGGNTDSVLAPPAIPGCFFGLYNNTANSIVVYGQQANQGGLAAGDKICANATNSAAAVATGVTMTTAQFAMYYCFVAGVWKQLLSA